MANPAPGFAQHPNYEVRIESMPQIVEVRVGEVLIARSDRAVQVLETRHRPVWYLPLEDVDQTVLRTSATDTFCPFKGHASYWSVVANGQTIDDALWAYMDPYDECVELAGYASFYSNKVDLLIDGRPAGTEGPGWV